MKNETLLLIDADVLIHLFKADKISLLNELFKNRCRMLDVVLDELRNNRTINSYLESIFIFSGIKEIIMPARTNMSLLNEYIQLKNKIRGDGERATLLYCKHYQHIIASSNTKDIKLFSEENRISYVTTLDLFCIAIHRNLMSPAEVNGCINKISNGSFVCCPTIEAHLERHFDTNKLLY